MESMNQNINGVMGSDYALDTNPKITLDTLPGLCENMCMATPTKKALPLEQALDNLLPFPHRESIRHDRCSCCNGDATNFDDALSVREYAISGFCQTCQDSVFNTPGA